MREYTDKLGVKVEFDELRLVETYAKHPGEGSHAMHRKMFLQHRLPWLLKQMGSESPYIVGQDELTEDGGLRPECGIARLSSRWAPSPENAWAGYSSLVVVWFQERGDPFENLAKVVAELDWAHHAQWSEM